MSVAGGFLGLQTDTGNKATSPAAPAAEILNRSICDYSNDCNSCCQATTTIGNCAPIVYGQMAIEAKIDTYSHWCCCVAWVPFSAFCFRDEVRKRAGLEEEDCCTGCCIHMWCVCCAMLQTYQALAALQREGALLPKPAAGAMDRDGSTATSSSSSSSAGSATAR